jgi:transcriptional regulator with XRE-family HTH domain
VNYYGDLLLGSTYSKFTGMNLPTRVDGGKIREARKAAGLSQSQLATRIGAHVTSISDWERGDNEPSARHLAGLADATNQPMDYFRAAPDRDRASGAVNGDSADADREGVRLDAA